MDDAEKVALLPCPFCGSTDLWDKQLDGTIVNPAYAVVCDNCGAQSRYSDRDYIAAWNTRQPQTDARVADLLFKLDVAATTFEKVTTSEHREAVFNAEHAKLLRDTIKVLRQPQSDALREKINDIKEAWDWWQVDTYDRCASVVEDAINAALKESK